MSRHAKQLYQRYNHTHLTESRWHCMKHRTDARERRPQTQLLTSMGKAGTKRRIGNNSSNHRKQWRGCSLWSCPSWCCLHRALVCDMHITTITTHSMLFSLPRGPQCCCKATQSASSSSSSTASTACAPQPAVPAPVDVGQPDPQPLRRPNQACLRQLV